MTKQDRSWLRDSLILPAALMFSLAGSCALMLSPPSCATRLTPDFAQTAKARFKGTNIRLDGSIQADGGQLFLPLLPAGATDKKNQKNTAVTVESQYPPDASAPDIVFFSNGWAYVRLLKKGDASTLSLAKNMPDKIRKHILALKLPSDLIVPEGLVLPRSFKALIQDVPSISLIDDATIYSADFGTHPKAASAESYSGNGTVFLTSIHSGSITMLDGKSLAKIAEFPTEGTPCGLEQVNGRIYVTDEAKSRVLIVDPLNRKFKGQIDLTARSAPRGIAAMPNGKWLYVSETAAGAVVCLESESGKVLVKTKTHPGPGRMVVTPDGVFLLVLNVSSGEVSVISTYNQQVVATIRVGDMPTAIVVSPDSKYAYVSNRNSNTVSIIDVMNHHVINTLKTAQSPMGLAMSPDGSRLYVASGRENSICSYDTQTLAKVSEVHTPGDIDFPGNLCMLPGGSRLLVCSPQTECLGVLDTQNMEFEKSIALGHPNNEASWEPVP